MSNRTLTDEQRRDIVRYRMENARTALGEKSAVKTSQLRREPASHNDMAAEIETDTVVRLHLYAEGDEHGRCGVVTGVIHAVDGGVVEAVFAVTLDFGQHIAGDYDDFINHTLETVDELLPQASLFIDILLGQLNEWLEDKH